MSKATLNDLSVAELVDRYTTIGLAQDKALLMDKTAEFNRLYEKKNAVEEELKSRPGDQRFALLRLYSHDNMQVRLNAVKSTLAVAPVQARRMLERIATSHVFPQAGDAGMTIDCLDRGIFKPT